MSHKLIVPEGTQKNTDSGITPSYKENLIRFARLWSWFLLGLIIAICLALVYLRNTTPVYKISSSIILKDARSEFRRGADNLDFALSGASSNVANELYILQSRSLIKKVLERLDLNILYIVEKKGRNYDLYNNSPVVIAMDQANVDTLRRSIPLQLSILENNSISVKGLSEFLVVDTIF